MFNMKSILEGYMASSMFRIVKPMAEACSTADPVVGNFFKYSPALFFGLNAVGNTFNALRISNTKEDDFYQLFFKEAVNLTAGCAIDLIIDAALQNVGFAPYVRLKLALDILQLGFAVYQYNHCDVPMNVL